MSSPCAFGESVSKTDLSCRFLEPMPQDDGRHPRYLCGIYDEIVGKPGSEVNPAFGAGCCSPLFNTRRAAILKEIGDRA